jgi:ribosomal protein L4
MIREHRHALVDDFIVGSDTYTKTARRIFEDGATTADIKLFEEDHVNNYNLQKARMRAYFGAVVDSLIAETDQLNANVFGLFKTQPNAPKEVWLPVIDALVKKNRETTEAALESITGARVLKSWGMG